MVDILSCNNTFLVAPVSGPGGIGGMKLGTRAFAKALPYL